MYANGLLFTYLFAGTPLLIWRQLLWVGLIFLASCVIKELYPIQRNQIVYFILFVVSVYFVFIGFFTYIIGYNINRIIFGIWLYSMGIPIYILSKYVFLDRRFFYKYVNFIICLGVFISIGLIIDYYTVLFTPIKATNQDVEFNREFSNRASFLSEASTVFSMLMFSSSLLCLLRYFQNKHLFNSSFYLICNLLIIMSSWFTGSRQIFLILLLANLLFYLIVLFNRNIRKNIKFYLSPLVVFILFSCLFSYLQYNSDSSLIERFTTSEIKDDSRYESWSKGYEEVFGNDSYLNFCFGNGIAYTQTSVAQQGEKIGFHYENTFLARLSETGVLGLILLIAPVLFILFKSYPIKTLFDIFSIVIAICFLVICMISPNGQFQISTIIIYQIAAFRKYKY